jgi:chemotaxis protein CheX
MSNLALVSEAAQALAEEVNATRAELIAPFVEATARVLAAECKEKVEKGKVYRVRSQQTNGDVNVLLAVTGQVSGLVVYSMTTETAMGLAAAMIGEPVPEFDELAQSAIAELGNIITGQAGIGLEARGFSSEMSPPVLLVNTGRIATFRLTRVVVPLLVSFGEFHIDIALKES